MRLALGPPPSSSLLGPTWTALREPGPWAMQALAVPLGWVLALGVLYAWARLAPARLPLSADGWVLFGAALLLILIHEALHAIAHPSFGLARQTVIGIWPSRMLVYAFYDGGMSRNRMILVLLLPTLVLTLLPLLLAVAWQFQSGWLILASSLNALLSGIDVCGALLLAAQVPSLAQVQNEGYKTYWAFRPAKA